MVNMPALRSTCGCLSLQVGVVTFSAVMMTLSLIILNLTIFNYKPPENIHFPITRILVLFFVTVLLLIAVISFIAAYMESRSLVLLSLGLLVLLFAFWLTMCIFSSIHENNVCIKKRCAPSLWMVRLEFGEPDKWAKYTLPHYNKTDLHYDESDDEYVFIKTDAGEYLKSLPVKEQNVVKIPKSRNNHYIKGNGGTISKQFNLSNIDGALSTGDLMEPHIPLASGVNVSKRRTISRKSKTSPTPYISENRRSTKMDKDIPLGEEIEKDIQLNEEIDNSSIYTHTATGPTTSKPDNITKQTTLFQSFNDTTTVHSVSDSEITSNGIHREGIDYEENKYGGKRFNNKGWHLKSGWHLFGYISLFITNMMFFLFNAINLWSYADELYYKFIAYEEEVQGEPSSSDVSNSFR